MGFSRCDDNLRSVRIESQATYNTGLFILDLNRAPWGCGAFKFHNEFVLFI